MNDYFAGQLMRERHRDFHHENVHHSRAAEMRRSLRALATEEAEVATTAGPRWMRSWFDRSHLHFRPVHIPHHRPLFHHRPH